MYSTACNLSKIFYDTASARRIADTIRSELNLWLDCTDGTEEAVSLVSRIAIYYKMFFQEGIKFY